VAEPGTARTAIAEALRRGDAEVLVSTWLEGFEGGVRIRVRVQPRSSRTEIVGEHDGALRIRVAAPPVDGEANAELVRFLAKRLGVAKSRVRIVAGETGRLKTVEVEGVTAEAAHAVLLGRAS
jgi:uncharacterized protein